jgi:hypothetical protein
MWLNNSKPDPWILVEEISAVPEKILNTGALFPAIPASLNLFRYSRGIDIDTPSEASVSKPTAQRWKFKSL